jgi:hypothetical protein
MARETFSGSFDSTSVASSFGLAQDDKGFRVLAALLVVGGAERRSRDDKMLRCWSLGNAVVGVRRGDSRLWER